MLLLLIDAFALVCLLKAINEDDMGFGSAFIIALVAAIGTNLLAYGLASVLGLAGVLLAAVIGAACVGVAVSAMLGVEIKRAFLIGGLFMVVHISVAIAFQMLLGRT